MRSPLQLLLALAFLAAPPRAAPQAPAFSTTPLVLRTPVNAAISLAPWSVPWTPASPPPYPSNDLFVSLGQQVHRHGWRSLAAPGPLGFGSPLSAGCAAAGLLNENGGDGLADLAFCYFTASPFQQGALLYFGDNPGAGWFAGAQPLGNHLASSLATAHLIDTRRDLLVTFDSNSPFTFTVLDLGGGGTSPTLAASVTWAPSASPGGDDVPLPIRLSPVTRGPARVQDLARSLSPGVDVLWNLAPSPTLSAVGFQLVNVPLAQETRGAAALDVDFDGIPDLVACLFSPAGTQPGKLVWVKNDDLPADLTAAAAAPGDLGARLGIADARLCRPLDLDGTPALAVWDAASAEIVVATSDAAGRRLLTWRGSTGGRIPFDIKAGDVVGSPVADLVVAYRDVGEVHVFPDAGDALPDLAWEPPPPASAIRGRDLPLSVVAGDVDGRVVQVDWFLGGSAAVSAAETAPPYAFAIKGSDLCGAPGPVAVLVRATDDVGLYRELEAAIPLADGPPLLSVAGAENGAIAVALGPGGTRIALDVAVSGCGVAVDWTPPPDLVAVGAAPGRQDAAGTVRLFLDVPEAAYPAILALPSLSFVAEVRGTSSPGGTATLPVRIDLDPGDLVAVAQAADRAELAQGDLALLTTTLRSAVSVDLPAVLVEEALDGLEPAGPVSVRGAQALAATATASGLAVMLDALPGGGMPVVLEVPVRRTLATAGSASARAVAPASGAALSREARLGPGRAALPGCGCGGAGGGAPEILLLLVYVKAMRRVPARTRSTSSRTLMRRQA